MDYKYIEQLLDRYFAAETTQQEEQILKTFFAQSDSEMPENISCYAPLFEAMTPKDELGTDFDERLLAMIGEKEETPVVRARVISLSQRLRPLFSAVAVIAILLTLTNALNISLQSETATTQDIVVADYDAPIATSQPTVAFDNGHLSTIPADSLKLDSARAKL